MKKVALFGAGRIGRIHAANLSAMPGIELVAVSDPVAAACADLAAVHGARVDSIEGIFADTSIDAVVIGSKIIQLIENEPREQVVPVVRSFLADIRRALD